MEHKLETILDLNRDPMLGTERGKIVYANTSARILFPGLKQGANAAELLPEFILSDPSPQFVASIGIAETNYTVSCADYGRTRIFSLSPLSHGGRSCLLSDGLMNNLLSSLFSEGLAIEQAASWAEEGRGRDWGRLLSILRHNHYSLWRQLSNLNTALLLQRNALFLEPGETDLVELCSDLASTVNTLVGSSRASIRFSSQQERLIAWVDARQIQHLLLNLLSNSLLHTPADGEILLQLSTSGENAILAVNDTGEGIPPDILQNIFSRYESAPDCDHLDRGMTAGLGLGIASGLAKLHGGTMIITSRETQGTSVRTMLPLRQPRSEMFACGRPGAETGGMDPILIELSGLLDCSFYTPQYID